jgi:hypothetical protein
MRFTASTPYTYTPILYPLLIRFIPLLYTDKILLSFALFIRSILYRFFMLIYILYSCALLYILYPIFFTYCAIIFYFAMHFFTLYLNIFTAHHIFFTAHHFNLDLYLTAALYSHSLLIRPKILTGTNFML